MAMKVTIGSLKHYIKNVPPTDRVLIALYSDRDSPRLADVTQMREHKHCLQFVCDPERREPDDKETTVGDLQHVLDLYADRSEPTVVLSQQGHRDKLLKVGSISTNNSWLVFNVET